MELNRQATPDVVMVSAMMYGVFVDVQQQPGEVVYCTCSHKILVSEITATVQLQMNRRPVYHYNSL